MTLDVQKLLNDMLAAAKTSFSKDWHKVEGYAKPELEKFAQNLADIAAMKLANTINEEKAKLQIDVQKKAMIIAMLTAHGLTILSVESAINAAIDVVRGTVNTTIGWTIL